METPWPPRWARGLCLITRQDAGGALTVGQQHPQSWTVSPKALDLALARRVLPCGLTLLLSCALWASHSCSGACGLPFLAHARGSGDERWAGGTQSTPPLCAGTWGTARIGLDLLFRRQLELPGYCVGADRQTTQACDLTITLSTPPSVHCVPFLCRGNSQPHAMHSGSPGCHGRFT